MKSIIWCGSALKDLSSFPDDARRLAGFQLGLVQQGLEPDDWKPMTIIGPGVREIRVQEDKGAWRVIYHCDRPEGIYVLHAFQKKTEKTSQRDIDLARQRFRSIGRPS